MKLKHLFWAQTVISLLNGAGALLMPDTWMGLYGVDNLTPIAAFTTRALGAGLLNYSIVAFLARDSARGSARKAIVIGFGITHFLGGLVVLQAVLTGVMAPAAWMAVGLYFVLALLYFYFWLIKGDA
jgi:hypothetical protein